MQVESPQLGFPNTFCCNCGATDCKSEDQDTRVTRFFSIGRTDTVFRLSVPVCTACRRTLRRRPAGFFSRLGMLLLFMAVIFGICFASITTVALRGLSVAGIYHATRLPPRMSGVRAPRRR